MKDARGRFVRTVMTAGLGLVLALEPATVALAESNGLPTGEWASPIYGSQASGTSSGETKLYVITKQDDLVAAEGSADAQMKVSIPVAIHYVADAHGNLTGPSNDTVKFVNHTKLGAVHVSKIAVENSGSAQIVKAPTGEGKLSTDQMCFFLQPVQGQSDAQGKTFVRGTATHGNTTDYVAVGSPDEFGNYANLSYDQATAPVNKGDWNIAPGDGALALNGLTGKVGGFASVKPATDYQAGVVHWVVQAGTRAEADKKAATVTVHFNANTGSFANHTPLPDQSVEVLDVDALPEKVEVVSAKDTPLTSGAGNVVGPKDEVNADGTVTRWVFDEWNTQADGDGYKIDNIGDFGDLSKIAGTVQEVYAKYVRKTS